MNFSRLFKLCILGLIASATQSFAQTTVVSDTFTYNSAASFQAKWQYVSTGGEAVSFSPGEPGLYLANALAIRDFSAQQTIASNQGWSISCDMMQTSFKRAQWFGLFTTNMCHGYVVEWNSSTSTYYGGKGIYTVYAYNSTKPISTWSTALGTPVATVLGNQAVTATVPESFQLTTSLDLANYKKKLCFKAVDHANLIVAANVEVADSNTLPYTRVVLSGNTTGVFSDLSLTAASAVYNVKNFGATGNGVTDDTVAIQNTINTAESNGGIVYLPGTSASYVYSNCLYVTGTTFYGDGTTSLLKATNPMTSAIVLEGNGVCLNDVKITSPNSKSVGRQSNGNTSGVFVYGASNFIVENVTVDTTASVGILCNGGTGVDGSPSLITHCSVANTLADGFHITNKSCYVNETNNSVSNSGDDMFAVVSYTSNGGMCHDILISNNTGSGQSTPGRGISVVGGENIIIENNNIQKSISAGIYLASEVTRNPNGSLLYKEYGDNNITVENNVINDCTLTTAQGSVQICGRPADTNPADGTPETAPMMITNVMLSGNTITNAVHSGICLDGNFNTVQIEGNTINTTKQQGLYVFGGSNLYVGELKGNTFENIGTYGVYTGITSSLSYTTGTIDIENNVFDNVNILGLIPIPVISIGSPTISGTVANNTVTESSQYLLLSTTVRFGVL